MSDKISTLMNRRTLLNNRTKFGAEIFRRYQVTTFYVLGHFLAAPCMSQFTKIGHKTFTIISANRKAIS